MSFLSDQKIDQKVSYVAGFFGPDESVFLFLFFFRTKKKSAGPIKSCFERSFIVIINNRRTGNDFFFKGKVSCGRCAATGFVGRAGADQSRTGPLQSTLSSWC